MSTLRIQHGAPVALDGFWDNWGRKIRNTFRDVKAILDKVQQGHGQTPGGPGAYFPNLPPLNIPFPPPGGGSLPPAQPPPQLPYNPGQNGGGHPDYGLPGNGYGGQQGMGISTNTLLITGGLVAAAIMLAD